MRRADRDLAKSQAKTAVSGKLKSSFAFLICFLFLVIFLVSACSTAEKPRVEAPPAPATPAAAEAALPSATNQPQQQVAANLPPPELKTVEEAVKRVFKDAALVDTTHQPAFVVGDFNGDSSQDVAVVIKPVSDKIADMNEEFPNWILRDPFGAAERSPRLKIAANDELLAVIHGYGPNGWHDPQATQTFLLKNVAGSGMQTQPVKDFAAANQGKKLPLLRGDLVGEVIEGKSGYLYFADATYAWYDPKTFKGDTGQPTAFHGMKKR
jgi:hypothetical protein